MATDKRMLEMQDELLAAIHLEVSPLKQELETIASYLDMAAEKHNGLADLTLHLGDATQGSLGKVSRLIMAISEHVGFDYKAWVIRDKQWQRDNL